MALTASFTSFPTEVMAEILRPLHTGQLDPTNGNLDQERRECRKVMLCMATSCLQYKDVSLDALWEELPSLGPLVALARGPTGEVSHRLTHHVTIVLILRSGRLWSQLTGKK
jgi:hypothetical protein